MLNLLPFLEKLPSEQRVIVQVLRDIILENLPAHFKEKYAFGVPSYYGKKAVCIVWPAAIKGGGIRQGVLLGFWQGKYLPDKHQYLTHGTNKKVFYKIYQSAEEIDEEAIRSLLREAVQLDQGEKEKE
jgi:hypothetical protein